MLKAPKCPPRVVVGAVSVHQGDSWGFVLHPSFAALCSFQPPSQEERKAGKIPYWVTDINPETLGSPFVNCPEAKELPCVQAGAAPPGISLTRASSWLCFCVSVFAASSCSWDSDKSCLNWPGETERNRKQGGEEEH